MRFLTIMLFTLLLLAGCPKEGGDPSPDWSDAPRQEESIPVKDILDDVVADQDGTKQSYLGTFKVEVYELEFEDGRKMRVIVGTTPIE